MKNKVKNILVWLLAITIKGAIITTLIYLGVSKYNTGSSIFNQHIFVFLFALIPLIMGYEKLIKTIIDGFSKGIAVNRRRKRISEFRNKHGIGVK